MTTARLTEDQFRDRMEYLAATSSFDLRFEVDLALATDDVKPAKVQDTLNRIKHAAAACQLYLSDHPGALERL